MKALILAAGRGSRMKRMTDARPKCLVEFRGRTLLEHQIEALHAAGIYDIGIVTGYRSDMLTGRVLTEFHNVRWADTNMVSSLACAHAWLSQEPCIVSYSDIFYEREAVSLLCASQADLAITYDPNWQNIWERRFQDPLSDAETFRLHENGTLAEIGNKPNAIEVIQGQYMGLLRLTPLGWSEIQSVRSKLAQVGRDQIHMTGILQSIIQAGKIPIEAIPYQGSWGEIDSESDLLAYE
ncbi:phosphocholine cytidylyltransferase family protein [Pusillimonas sp. SM2304]|uniref:phosphocholine cytidylyltransferase family protein n=1 Tax=Pusillimonas sp. SM2304 TaxID=3073241 RepID=UPI002874E7D6|nr:phosphocholine cytidylyltransferase family protein [Pusillimonas sp. SM2304]MDS1141158.1 phosphocholine cytidylyltransferase family protein [Pusillimonas sp. SM2304]